jgi:PhoH-like ATPase
MSEKPTIFVIDTNIILHDAQSVMTFGPHTVIVPMVVLEELDHFKKEMNDLGRNSRAFSRFIDAMREKGSLIDGIPLHEHGGILRVDFCTDEFLCKVPSDMDHKMADTRILAVAIENSYIYQDQEVVLITRDMNLRIKADVVGIRAETYDTNTVSMDEMYTGVIRLPEGFRLGFYPVENISPNEFVIDEYGVMCRYDAEADLFNTVPDSGKICDLEPRNDEQRMALDILLDDNIKLVTLVGKAGTGKTLLALAAGIKAVTEDFTYRKLLVGRPVFQMGKDIGFLPGDIREKLAPYMQPIYDNVEFLLSGYQVGSSRIMKPLETKKKLGKSKGDIPANDSACIEKERGQFGNAYMELLAAGIMEIEPLTYIRGRSIPNQYLIIDEAQNLTPHEVKTIITRAGEGTKIILTGDPQQIDNPWLDASSNGLTYVVERFRNQKIAAHITLTKGERSELASIAAEIL